jgi:tRNA U38,U39,U40 pseudouridine synthase TruA
VVLLAVVLEMEIMIILAKVWAKAKIILVLQMLRDMVLEVLQAGREKVVKMVPEVLLKATNTEVLREAPPKVLLLKGV